MSRPPPVHAEFWGHVLHDTKDLASHLMNDDMPFEYPRDMSLSYLAEPVSTLCRVESDASLISLGERSSEPFLYTQFSSLWEVQLELGEIPDMLSNNLLEPCVYHLEDRDDGAKEPQFCPLGDIAEEDLESEDQDQSVCDGWGKDEGEEEEEASVPSSGSHVYGGVSFSQTEGDSRHDRKDSGVFLADQDSIGDEGYYGSQGSIVHYQYERKVESGRRRSLEEDLKEGGYPSFGLEQGQFSSLLHTISAVSM